MMGPTLITNSSPPLVRRFPKSSKVKMLKSVSCPAIVVNFRTSISGSVGSRPGR